MNNKTGFARALVLASLLMAAGCTSSSMMFDYEPQPVALAGQAETEGQALVLGQAYMRGYGDWVQLIISAVDGTQTLSATQLRPNINFLVPQGKRTLQVKVLLGNSMKWQEAREDPQVTAELRAGLVYQVKAREATDIRGQTGVELWLERLGTVEEYQAFLKRHPGFKQGQPLSPLDLTS